MITNFKNLEKLRRKNRDKKIVFCIGVFDMTHVGHILFFEDCKKQGDILVVGIGRDSFVKSYKGDQRPILNEKIRLKTVDSLKPVDYTFLDTYEKWKGEKTHKENLGSIFKLLKPDTYVVNEEGVDIEERRKITHEMGIKLVVLPRYCPEEFENISTTKIIDKIKKL